MKDPWDVGRDPLEALRSGDRGPFEDFVRLRAQALVGFFHRLGAGAAEAEDLTQDVFLKLYQGASRYRQQGTFGAYVLRVANNAWIDRRRRAALRPSPASFSSTPGPLEAPEPAGRERAPEAGLEQRDETARLHRAIAALPDGQARAFELAVLQGLPYVEISRLLDIPVGTVKSRVHHAVQRLRQVLESRRGVS